jgi:integrase/recombinase XerD
MPKRGEYKDRLSVGDPSDPLGMGRAFLDFFAWLKVMNYSEGTLITYDRNLRYFIAWCETRGLMRPAEITQAILERYQRTVSQIVKPNTGQTIAFISQMHYLVPVRQFFRWLAKSHKILFNPAAELELPRKERRLPKAVLSAGEAEQVMNQVNMAYPMGLRDRAILETFYSTGIRRMELMNLSLYDLDFDRGTVMIRQGKGKRDRVIPIGERALAWIQKYRNDLRPSLIVGSDEGVLFLTKQGEAMTPNLLSHMVRLCVDGAGLGKRGSCHIFRHTMATLMLEHGADVRFVQEMLGHADLSTTQIYTRVSIVKLKEVHTQTHPSAHLARVKAQEE